MDIGDRIRAVMKAKGLKQEGLGELANYSGVAIGKIINKKNEPKFGLLSSIIKHFPDINGNWLLTGEGQMYGTEISDLADVKSISIAVVKRQKELLNDPLFVEFVEKMAYKRMLEIEKESKSKATGV